MLLAKKNQATKEEKHQIWTWTPVLRIEADAAQRYARQRHLSSFNSSFSRHLDTKANVCYWIKSVDLRESEKIEA